MELFGKHYLIEHIIERLNADDKHEAFDFFISEMLRALTEFPKTWKEMLEYKPETRSPEEIKSHFIKSLGG